MGHEKAMTIEDAIQHCYEVAELLRKNNPCDSCATEHEQLAKWLEELVQLRATLPDIETLMVERDGMRSNWYKSIESIKALKAERDAAVSDLRKLVPAWRWDGTVPAKEHGIPKCERVEFG